MKEDGVYTYYGYTYTYYGYTYAPACHPSLATTSDCHPCLPALPASPAYLSGGPRLPLRLPLPTSQAAPAYPFRLD